VVAAKEATSRFHKGDFVVYRYSGLFSTEPVEVRERVVEQNGNHVTFDVVATRGSEQRHWSTVVTDTPENARGNVIDALYEYTGAERHKLDNANNADLVRLGAWTVLADGKDDNVHSERAMLEVGHDSFTCDRAFGTSHWHGRALKFERFECPDLLWKHGRARYWDESTGEEIFRADVADLGNQP
jgi:hypothetical protein